MQLIENLLFGQNIYWDKIVRPVDLSKGRFCFGGQLAMSGDIFGCHGPWGGGGCYWQLVGRFRLQSTEKHNTQSETLDMP